MTDTLTRAANCDSAEGGMMRTRQYARGRLVGFSKDETESEQVAILLLRDEDGCLRPIELWRGQEYSVTVDRNEEG